MANAKTHQDIIKKNNKANQQEKGLNKTTKSLAASLDDARVQNHYIVSLLEEAFDRNNYHGTTVIHTGDRSHNGIVDSLERTNTLEIVTTNEKITRAFSRAGFKAAQPWPKEDRTIFVIDFKTDDDQVEKLFDALERLLGRPLPSQPQVESKRLR